MLKTTTKTLSRATLALSVMLLSSPAFAAGTAGTDAMPWEGGLETISTSLQGRTAYFIAIIGFIIAGIGFVIQGELSGWAKKMIQIVMGIAVLLGVVGLIGIFFGVSSAVII